MLKSPQCHNPSPTTRVIHPPTLPTLRHRAPPLTKVKHLPTLRRMTLPVKHRMTMQHRPLPVTQVKHRTTM